MDGPRARPRAAPPPCLGHGRVPGRGGRRRSAPRWLGRPPRPVRRRTLPPRLGDYVESTEHLLRAVGDRLAAVAVSELTDGVNAGETVDQLRARLRTVFAREGAQLGEVREERIARTESARAWNSATLAAAQALAGPDRPLVKQWITRRDTAVRDTHAKVNGQLRLLDEPFTVAGVSMSAPGDPTAPPELVVNCRCVLALARADQAAAFKPKPGTPGDVFESQENQVEPNVTAAADGSHRTGAMIALMPTPEDAERLAVQGGEPAGELHTTLYFLGEGADWSQDQRNELIADIETQAADLMPPRTGTPPATPRHGCGTSETTTTGTRAPRP